MHPVVDPELGCSAVGGVSEPAPPPHDDQRYTGQGEAGKGLDQSDIVLARLDRADAEDETLRKTVPGPDALQEITVVQREEAGLDARIDDRGPVRRCVEQVDQVVARTLRVGQDPVGSRNRTRHVGDQVVEQRLLKAFGVTHEGQVVHGHDSARAVAHWR